MDFLDTDDKHSLPPPPVGMRYLDFLGGTKRIRCYLVPEDMPRLVFLRDYSELLDPALLPVFECDSVSVRQDTTYALPGFYIVSLQEHLQAFDQMDRATYMRMMQAVFHTRQGMRDKLGIEHIHLHYEEKPSASANVHIWLMPVDFARFGKETLLVNLDLRAYLTSFDFSKERKKILDFNQKVRQYLALTMD